MTHLPLHKTPNLVSSEPGAAQTDAFSEWHPPRFHRSANTPTHGAHPSQGKGRPPIVVGFKVRTTVRNCTGEPRGSEVIRRKAPSEEAAIGIPERLLLADTVEKLHLRGGSKFLSLAGTSLRQRHGGPHQFVQLQPVILALALGRLGGPNMATATPQREILVRSDSEFFNSIGAKRTFGDVG